MYKGLLAWYENEKENSLLNLSCDVSDFQSGSAFIDVNTGQVIGRITVSDAGYLELSCLNLSDGNLMDSKHHDLDCWSDAEPLVDEFVGLIKSY